MSTTGPSILSASWWALRAARRARRGGGWSRLGAVRLPAVPAVDDRWGRWAVSAVLRVRRESCLVQAIVVQAWDAAYGRPRDLVIGVSPPGADFFAHAWLDGDDPGHDDLRELVRRPPSTR